jgi:hypothetical protein
VLLRLGARHGGRCPRFLHRGLVWLMRRVATSSWSIAATGDENAGAAPRWHPGTRKVVGATGFEPATPCAQGRCATRLRYAPTRR